MITSIQNETIKKIMKLKQKKYRDEYDLFLVEGFHLVEEARKAGCIQTLITTLDEAFPEETLYVHSKVMEKIAFTKTPQPVMAVCRKQHQTLDTWKERYLLLDNLQDPGNLGTIIRSALALGYDQIIMSPESVDLYNDKVIRATQGALFQMPLCQMDLLEAIALLHKQGVGVYGTSLHQALPIDYYQPQKQMAFVLGNEGQGVSQTVLDACDHTLYIPIQGIESLNVAIAGAIVMYHFPKI